MRLLDLRKIAIRREMQIRFRMRNGMDCVVTETGAAQVPSWKGIPDFNLEEDLDAADRFFLEPSAPAKGKNAPAPRAIDRAELDEMVSGAAQAGAAPEHEEE